MVRAVVWSVGKGPGWPVAETTSPIPEHRDQLLSGKSRTVHVQRAASKTRAALPQWFKPSGILHFLQNSDRCRQQLPYIHRIQFQRLRSSEPLQLESRKECELSRHSAYLRAQLPL